MDLDMPVMGGLEAARTIRQLERKENRKRTLIVAISGTTMQNPHLECSEAGMDDFIAKPLTVSTMLEIILPLVK